MITYKRIDLILQVLLLAAAIICLPLDEFDSIILLMILGGLQLISTFVHFFFGKVFWASIERIIYYTISGITLVWLYGALTGVQHLGALLFLPFFTAGIAIYYMIICGMELRKLKKEKE